MNRSPYIPSPLDTSKVTLSEDILHLSEFYAENAHEVWAEEKIAQGWRFGPNVDEEKREHPLLIPYKDLPENEKRYDRKVAQECIKAILSTGYRLERPTDDTIHQESDLDAQAKLILTQFKNPKLTAAELRRLWEQRLAIVWYRNVEIYRRAVEQALKLGEAFLAFDMTAEGLQAFKRNLRLIQLQALALARTGATKRANQILDQLRAEGHQDEETLGLLARTHKDFWAISADEAEKKHNLKICYEMYLDSYRRNGGYYSGINAASMGLIYGVKEVAEGLAREVTELCQASLAKLGPESDERYWLEATLAEAALIRRDFVMAEDFYIRASKGGQSSVVLSRTRGQARLLLEYIEGNPNRLDHCFRLPRIVVFSGHMFDRPGRTPPRFPHTLEPLVREEFSRRLKKLDAQIVFSSLACGGDTIVSELILERGGEVNVTLPFKKDDFVKSSVEIFPGVEWVQRFNRVMQDAATVTILSELGDTNDAASYDYCNMAINGLALLKGQFLGMDVVPLVLWDGLRGDGRGGTQTFVDFWQKRGAVVEVIELDKIVAAAPAALLQPVAVPVVSPNQPHAEAVAPDTAAAKPLPPQEIKAMLFADIVGFTKLSETQVPGFVENFLGKVARLMNDMKCPPIHQNTWGDAVCCVFDNVSDAGVFALNLRDMVRGTNWNEWGLPNDLNIRIALHAGPVFPCFDPVLKKLTYNGSHVNKTARIEPVSEEGQVYASQAFAALAASEGVAEYVCDYVGTIQLAKKYGAIAVFLVRRNV